MTSPIRREDTPQPPSCRYDFHPDTLRVLEQEVRMRMVLYPTQHYLKPLLLTINYHKDKGGIEGLYIFLNYHVVQNLNSLHRSVIYEEKVHFERLIANERKVLAAIHIISRHLHSGKKGAYTHAFNAIEKSKRGSYYNGTRLKKAHQSLCK